MLSSEFISRFLCSWNSWVRSLTLERTFDRNPNTKKNFFDENKNWNILVLEQWRKNAVNCIVLISRKSTNTKITKPTKMIIWVECVNYTYFTYYILFTYFYTLHKIFYLDTIDFGSAYYRPGPFTRTVTFYRFHDTSSKNNDYAILKWFIQNNSNFKLWISQDLGHC